MEHRLPPKSVAAIWLGGAALAALAYAVGPDRFLDRVGDLLDTAETGWLLFVGSLERASFDVLRALAIGLFIVFVTLAVIAVRRGLRGRVALVFVSSFYLAAIGSGESRSGWTMAFLLALVGAASMTGRLLRTEPRPRGTR